MPNLKRLYLNGPRLTALPSGLLDNHSHLTNVEIYLCDLDRLPDDFLVHTPRLQSLYLVMDPYRCHRAPGPKFLPERFLSHTPNLTRLVLGLQGLKALPPSFLAHVPRLQHLELMTTLGKGGKFTYPISSLPAHFLENAPSLTYLDLWPVVRLSNLPADFLARSSRLRHLYLDVNGVSVVPDGFLTQVPYLQRLELDLEQVDALPDGFLAHTPWLRHLKLDVDRVGALPVGFLEHAPHLEGLSVRATNIVALPKNFLVYSPQIEALDLGMPQLESPPEPGDALWDTLQSTSFRVKVISSDFEAIYDEDDHFCSFFDGIEPGDILEVHGREQDSEGNILLRAFYWWTRDLFFTFYERGDCLFKVDFRITEPTLDV